MGILPLLLTEVSLGVTRGTRRCVAAAEATCAYGTAWQPPFPQANTIMGLSMSRKSTHLVDLVRLAASLPNVGSIVAYLHIYLSSDVHANLHSYPWASFLCF